MDITVEEVNDVAIAVLPVTDLDASNSDEFKRDMAPVLESHARVIIDGSNLQFIDSSGLGALLSCLRKLSSKSGELKVCGLAKHVRAVFELVRLHHIIEIVATREDALRAFKA
jgi:anti-sigma B factor antagonist